MVWACSIVRETGRRRQHENEEADSHLALEVLHDVQEVVVHVRLVLELLLDRVEVAERIGHVQRSPCFSPRCASGAAAVPGAHREDLRVRAKGLGGLPRRSIARGRGGGTRARAVAIDSEELRGKPDSWGRR